MKKMIIMLAAALLAWTACQPDHETDPEEPVEETVFNFTFEMGCPNTSTLDFIDLSVTYTDANGKKLTEKVTSLPWKKTIEGLKPGFTVELEKTIVLKENIDVEKIEGDAVTVSDLNLACFYKGSDGSMGQFGSPSPMTISKYRLVEYLNRLIERNKPYTFTHQPK